jgi:hypothetical protein
MLTNDTKREIMAPTELPPTINVIEAIFYRPAQHARHRSRKCEVSLWAAGRRW